MKKSKLLFFLIITSFLTSCNTVPSDSNIPSEEVSSEEISGEQVELNVINEDTFRLSSINDFVTSDGTITYKMVAPYDDTYEISCYDATLIEVFDKNKVLIYEHDWEG